MLINHSILLQCHPCLLILALFNRPNIGLTFKAWPELLRGIGVVCAWEFCTNHDKRLYKVEAFVRLWF